MVARSRDLFELTETRLVLGELDPAHHGLRVAQLSDLHVGRATPESRVQNAVTFLNELCPDLVLLTGDFVTRSAKPILRLAPLLGGLQAPCAAVLGNHDHWVAPHTVRRELERAGFAVLQNEHTFLRLRGTPVCLLGVDDGFTGHDDVERTFRMAPRFGTRLVLTHNPPTVHKLAHHSGLAVFAGHTHGGHVVVPRVTRAVFRRAGQPYLRGHYRVGTNQLYVNRGLGFGSGGPALRVGARPEVSLFTLDAPPA